MNMTVIHNIFSKPIVIKVAVTYVAVIVISVFAMHNIHQNSLLCIGQACGNSRSWSLSQTDRGT